VRLTVHLAQYSTETRAGCMSNEDVIAGSVVWP